MKFAVYNAGSKDITLDQEERVFMLWYADLNEDSPDPYGPLTAATSVITSNDVDKLKGEVASPAELKKQVDNIKHDYDKRLQSVELKQTIFQWLACALIILILGNMFRTGWFDRAIELANRSGAVTQANRPHTDVGAPATITPKRPDSLKYYILGAGSIVGVCLIGAAFIVRKRQK